MAKKDKAEKNPALTDNFGDKIRSNHFQKTPSNAGRKPNPCKAFAQKYGYIEVTPKDVLMHIQAIYGAPLSVLREIIADPEAPHILRLLAREFINAEEAEAKERYLAIKMISEFTDRIAGKAPQHITVTQENNAVIDLSALTEEELLKYTELTSKLSQ